MSERRDLDPDAGNTMTKDSHKRLGATRQTTVDIALSHDTSATISI
jgi:hypothetical protein